MSDRAHLAVHFRTACRPPTQPCLLSWFPRSSQGHQMRSHQPTKRRERLRRADTRQDCSLPKREHEFRSQHPHKKLGMVVCLCNPGIKREYRRTPGLSGCHPRLAAANKEREWLRKMPEVTVRPGSPRSSHADPRRAWPTAYMSPRLAFAAPVFPSLRLT